MEKQESEKEIEKIRKRYEKRISIPPDLYNPLKPDVLLRRQEFEKLLSKLLRDHFSYNLSNLKLLEIGCGLGKNLLKFIEIGFIPENLTGNELLESRLLEAKKILPASVKLIEGNALDLKFPSETFDIVFQSTVFSSILDEQFQKELAAKMLSWVKHGRGILWYDFIYNNPFNPDVKGISRKRVQSLFPKTKIYSYKITLAPPIARLTAKITPSMYTLLNIFPIFRTHLLVWLQKM